MKLVLTSRIITVPDGGTLLCCARVERLVLCSGREGGSVDVVRRGCRPPAPGCLAAMSTPAFGEVTAGSTRMRGSLWICYRPFDGCGPKPCGWKARPVTQNVAAGRRGAAYGWRELLAAMFSPPPHTPWDRQRRPAGAELWRWHSVGVLGLVPAPLLRICALC